ncbi:MAG: HAD family phosphatase [Bauldia sp.]|uniref:HAD family hydrolase n=1 Tax=Bauldia sp. TaxID=2575872 RepID=UPI001DE5AC87|nr:HAD family phosphatase [Bauldia sp.]MCB1497806.1 HAD family phosphatase [Bauldia sp.]
MNAIAAMAWDIDGTLVDSEPLHQETLVTVCRRHGFDVETMPADTFLGVHLHDVWDALHPHLGTAIERDAWIEEITRVYVDRRTELVQQRDATMVIGELATQGLRQVCVSNSGRAIVDANVDSLGIGETIEFSISFDDVARGKPDPEPYRIACERLGLDPWRVAAVEDSATGAASAKAAGLFVIGFDPTGGMLPGADTTVKALADILPLLDRQGRTKAIPTDNKMAGPMGG